MLLVTSQKCALPLHKNLHYTVFQTKRGIKPQRIVVKNNATYIVPKVKKESISAVSTRNDKSIPAPDKEIHQLVTFSPLYSYPAGGTSYSSTELVFLNVYGAQESISKNEFRKCSLCSLAGRYDNPIPTWFLAPIDC